MLPNSSRYHNILAGYFSAQPLFFDCDLQKKPNIRKCVEQPFQQNKAQQWDEITDTLCNLDFIQAKACARMTYDLVKDFNAVLQVIPDNAENIREENERQRRMDKYSLNLISYAKGEIKELEVPETVPLWSEEKINSEIERIKINPSRLDRLKDFRNFLGQEAGNLQSYASEYPFFATQQAWNYSKEGPVGITAGHEPSERYKYLVLRTNSTRPEFDPFPQTFQILNGHTDKVCSISVTPDGQHFISCSNDETCILWDLNTGEALKILKGHTGKVTTVSITPDGQRAISCSDDKTCILWNLNTGETIQILKGHTKSVICVSITPDGKRAISCDSGNVFILWDLEAGAILKTLKGEVDFSSTLFITQDCRWAIAAALMENACIVWDLVSGKVVQILKGHSDTVWSLTITPNGNRAFSGSTDGKCILWDLSTGKLLRSLKGKGPYVSALSITANGKMAVSGYYNKTCILWDLTTGEPIQTLIGHNELISAISITPDGQKVISGSDNGTCIVWNLNTVKKSRALQCHNDKVTRVFMANEVKRAISISKDYKCLLWDLLTGEALPIIKDNSESRIDRVYENIFPIAGYNNIILTIQEINTFKPIRTIKGRASYASITSFTPDGKLRIDSSTGYSSVLKNIKTGKTISVLEGHYVCITPDGQRAISKASDYTCILWDLATGEALHSLEGHTDSINEVSITPDGQRAITCSEDKTCIIWDLNKGKKLSIFVSVSGISTITWIPGGLFGGTSNKTFILDVHNDMLCPERIIVTIRCTKDDQMAGQLKYYAECPACGNRFKPQVSALTFIETIKNSAKLKSDQSPCLELLKEKWNDPALKSACPKCKEQLKFNPFILDEDEFNELTFDERFLMERLWLKTSLRDAYQRE